MASQVVISFADLAALQQELRDNLERGGAFVLGDHGLGQDDECEAVIVHPAGPRLCLPARVVLVVGGATPGVGLAFVGFDAALRDAVIEFVGESAEPTPDQTAEPCDQDEPDRIPRNVHERLRRLTVNEQLKVAREGDVNERVVLERMYGKTVWEALLRNSRVTLPEVTRIARMGALPRPLLELIVGTAAWLTSGQIRRGLLQNHRLTREMVEKVLRATPKHELKLIPKQTAYPHPVREAARRLLGV
ncbi:MAG TPA: hypothetical protein VML75_25920 [Kofleriaceae bacterium]|nr:hypothetical protein [Kofleriaceae bacterium]